MNQPDRPQRRWYQFTLRGLLAAITLVAVLLGLRLWQVRGQQEAIARIYALGGSAATSYETIAPDWLRPLCRVEVSTVNLEGTAATNDDVRALADLTSLTHLKLNRTRIAAGGLKPLGRLKRLGALSLAETSIAGEDLADLRPLERLAFLDLHGTPISDEGLAHLQALPFLQTLEVQSTRVTEAGVARLAWLPNLARLGLDERQIGPASVAALQKTRRPRQLTVLVRSGDGKRAWEALAPLKNVQATGVLGENGPVVWTASAAWEDTGAGLVEKIRSQVRLTPEQETALRVGLAEVCPGGVWQPRTVPVNPSPPPKPGPEPEPIQTIPQLIEVLEKNSRDRPQRVRQFAHSPIARTAVPILLQRIQRPILCEADYGRYRCEVLFLALVAATDPQVLAALSRSLNAQDPAIRRVTVFALSHDAVGPADPDSWPPYTAEQVDAIVPLLLGCAKDPDSSVRLAVAEALGMVVPLHPRHAKTAVAALLAALEGENTVYLGVYALRQIAKVCPEQTQVIFPRLHANLRSRKPVSPIPVPYSMNEAIREALGELASLDRQIATEFVPVLLAELADEPEHESRFAGGALAEILRRQPHELERIIHALIAMLRSGDPQRRRAVLPALKEVGQAVWEQKTR